MFIKLSQRGYTRDGQQTASGLFLMLVDSQLFEDIHYEVLFKRRCPARKEPPLLDRVRGIVRFVRMHQCGHFMMGHADFRLNKFTSARIPLSGTYGGDGLLRTVPHWVWKNFGVTVPHELMQKWAKGGGHNDAGSEAQDMHDWALANLSELYKTRGKKSRLVAK